MSRKFIVSFLLVLTFEIIAGELNFLPGVYFLKPAIVLSLLFLVITKGFVKNKWFIIALFFSLAGDILLMLNLPILFLFGLGSFLITHLLYIGIFQQYATFKPLIFGVFLVAVSGYFLVFLNNRLPETLLVPVIIYMLVITLMGIIASSVNLENRHRHILGIGAVLFIISDSIIAYNKFVEPLPYPTLLIMSNYGIAQLLITRGYLQLTKP